ncbi:phosphate acyltransferase [uncultured Veillonella sp.]|uniref:phosphate acyltransferase n=1 Tax=uncultured Veillonella sp. TaxID=159268 RepID=UPI00260AFCFD|nr:phosphate acyltransferase [uncultured Veillonella sp.]
MNMMEQIKAEAKPWRKNIAMLIDADARMLQGAAQIIDAGFATVTLIGKKQEILQLAAANHIAVQHMTIVDVATDYRLRSLANSCLKNKGQAQGLGYERAIELLTTNPAIFALMFVAAGHADGLIVGNSYKYSTIAEAATQIIGLKKGQSAIASTTIMHTKTPEYGQQGVLFFSDCEVVKNPTAEQLADIAINTADLAEKVFGIGVPRVSLLSFSSKGSASDPLVDKVVNAYNIVKEKHVVHKIDGELQLDASIVPSVAKSKAPQSDVAGKANVLIFPDLNAANIGCNLVKLFGSAQAFGPLLIGAAKPVQRVPEEYSVEDLVNLAAITAVESTL